MTATEKTIQHSTKHELIIENHKCIIDCSVYNNEDLRIDLEDLTSKDIYLYSEFSAAIESFTNKCKASMTGLEFYNMIESAFDGKSTLNSYKCQVQGDDIELIITVIMPLAHGKQMHRSFPLILKKQEQKDVDRMVKIMNDLHHDKESIMNMKQTIDKFPKLLEAIRNDFTRNLNDLKSNFKSSDAIMIEDRVHNIELDLSSIEINLSNLQNSSMTTCSRVDKLEQKFNDMVSYISTISKLEQKVDTDIQALTGKLDTTNGELTALKTAYNNMVPHISTISKLEQKFNTDTQALSGKLETANTDIVALKNSLNQVHQRPVSNVLRIDHISFGTRTPFVNIINVGNFNKQQANTSLIIEAHLCVYGRNNVYPAVDFVFGNCSSRGQYINQSTTGNLTILSFIVCMYAGMIVGGSQQLSIKFNNQPFTLLNCNENDCPGSGIGQTVSTFKITEFL